MDYIGVLWTFVAVLVGTAAASGLMFVWVRANRTTATISRTLMKEAEGSITFLFDDEQLVNVTPRAKSLMDRSDTHRTDWENFVTLMSARFPHLRSQCRNLATVGHKTIAPDDSQPGWIEAEFWHGLARITLVQDRDRPDEMIDALTAVAMEHELETLRSIGEDSPQLIWKRDAEGVLVWANRSYIELSEALYPVDADESYHGHRARYSKIPSLLSAQHP